MDYIGDQNMASGNLSCDSQDRALQLRECALSEIPNLVKQFGDVNVTGMDGCTALHGLNDSLERCKILIEYGADVNSKNEWGCAPLHVVESPEICKLLLEHGANVNARTIDGQTPLHFAKNAQICQILIENGADINAENYEGYTPLKTAIGFHEEEDVLHLLLYYGADTNFVHKSSIRTNVFHESLEWLHREGRTDLIEILFHYAYDKVQEPIHFELLTKLAGIEELSHLFTKLLDSISIIRFSKRNSVKEREAFLYNVLHKYHPDNLRSFLKTFKKTIVDSLQLLREYPDWVTNDKYYDTYHSFPEYENSMVLAEYDLLEDYIQVFHEKFVQQCYRLLDNSFLNNGDVREEVTRFVLTLLTLLSYGLGTKKLGNLILDDVYNTLGDCELFRILLHFDWRKSDEECSVLMAQLIYDVQLSMDIYLERPNPEDIYRPHVVEVLSHFAHPKLVQLCRLHYDGPHCGDIVAKVKQMPKVPKLLELARNAARQHIIKKFNMVHSKQFYTYVRHLEIAQVYKDILSLRKKLYV